jgi:hypothetical protein
MDDDDAIEEAEENSNGLGHMLGLVGKARQSFSQVPKKCSSYRGSSRALIILSMFA